MVIKPIIVFLSVCLITMIVPFAGYTAKGSPGNAEESETANENSIIMVEKETADDSGTVTITVSVADHVTFPVTMIMEGAEGTISLTVTYNGQSVKMKPGTYRLDKVTDVNGAELDAGAILTIPEEGGNVYLDFHKPGYTNDSTWKQFVLSNLQFILFMLFLYVCYQWYKKINS